MKTENELLEMRDKFLKNWEKEMKDEFGERMLEEFKNDNFIAYNYEEEKIRICEDYSTAKAWADRGGQILVINTHKIYNYKVKTFEEYSKYLDHQIRKENQRMMDYYGI